MVRIRQFAILLLCGVLCLASRVAAQTETATVSGRVSDSSGAVVPGANVELHSVERGIVNATVTNGAGIYVFPSVHPGQYRIAVRKEGFRRVDVLDFVVNVQDHIEQNFKLALGSVSESLTVIASAVALDISGSVGTVVDQKLVTELPLNGRSFQSLFQLVPGVATTQTDPNNQGQFSVNGQRSNANYFMVDGTSANASVAASFGGSQSFGGSLPVVSALGGTNTLVSTEAVQEFSIATSSYAAEFGRTPGAQVSIVTRSGTNKLHGALFNYFRNDVFDANDWFANHDGLPRAALRQNDFGGVLGGPLLKSHTFFFLSYEGLRLRQPTTAQSDVPTVAARNSAPAQMRPFFDAYPMPTGSDQGNGLAPANGAFSNPSSLDAGSIRVDHRFRNSLQIFGRYNHAPSVVAARGTGGHSLNTITTTAERLRTLTLGLTHSIKTNLIEDARFNWTSGSGTSSFTLDGFGGATPLPATGSFLPASCVRTNCIFALFLSLAARHPEIESGTNVANSQRQLNFLDNLSWQVGSHLFKLGVDYRRLTPQFNPFTYLQQAVFLDINSALAMQTIFGTVESSLPVRASYNNYSLYAQDRWIPDPRINLTFGLRWDYNPAPTGRGSDGSSPALIRSSSNLQNLMLAPPGTPLYSATLNNIAPRLGVAYQLRSSANTETLIHAGAGVFYDLGSGPTGTAFQNVPFSSVKFVPSGTVFPFDMSRLRSPLLFLERAAEKA